MLLVQVFILLFIFCIKCNSQKYSLTINKVDKDSALPQLNFIRSAFPDSPQCVAYIHSLPSILYNKGYIAASIDSVSFKHNHAEIWLYLGPAYKGVNFFYDSAERQMSFENYAKFRSTIIDQNLSEGYPFASVRLINTEIKNDFVNGRLIVTHGPLYHIDSIRLFGKLMLKRNFLSHYLSITPGSVYNLHNINNIQKKLTQLPFVSMLQKPDILMLGSGAVVNIYADPKKSNQVSALLGFLPGPNNSGAKITADIDLNLKNSFHSGESIILNWQQLQQQSPKLNLAYLQPYIFKSIATLNSRFDLFKRDSSYVLLNGILGIGVEISETQSANIIFQSSRSYLLQGAFDTSVIKATKTLPQNIDYSRNQIGVAYHFTNVDYILNPGKGSNIDFTVSSGFRKVNLSNDIINLKDPATPSYDFKKLYDSLNKKENQIVLKLIYDHYFKLNKKTVLKMGLNSAGISGSNLFKNEVFVIGGYKLLRGFDEESVYTNKYAVFTTEYRVLTGVNSYLFFFNDVAVTESKFQGINTHNNFVSIGSGISFETKAGVIKVVYAIGKRNDIPFNLTPASKIHFGYFSYF